jgi:hypothetical protein
VQALRERGGCDGERPRFYGGSLLKVRSKSVVRGLSPKASEMAWPLCACASLRFFERGTLECRSEVHQKLFSWAELGACLPGER